MWLGALCDGRSGLRFPICQKGPQMDAPSEHRDQGQEDDPTDHRQQRAANQDEATTLGLAPWLGREPRQSRSPTSVAIPPAPTNPTVRKRPATRTERPPLRSALATKTTSNTPTTVGRAEEEELAEPARRRVATTFRGSRP